VALFHATSAHGISTFRAFPSQPAATPLGARCSLAVESAATLSNDRPCLLCLDGLSTSPSRHPPRLSVRRQRNTDDIIRTESVSKPPKRYDERSQQPLERDAQTLTKALPSSVRRPHEAGSNRREPRLQSLTPAESPFPIRQSLDHRARPMLSWPSPSPRFTRSAVGLSPSPHALAAWPPQPPPEEDDHSRPLGHASGSRSD
jgi:hypothetical protein